jgi:hypothetical protein
MAVLSLNCHDSAKNDKTLEDNNLKIKSNEKLFMAFPEICFFNISADKHAGDKCTS